MSDAFLLNQHGQFRCPSDVQKFVTPYFFELHLITVFREGVKLSVINKLLPFSFLLFIKISFLTAQQVNLTIMGRGFWFSQSMAPVQIIFLNFDTQLFRKRFYQDFIGILIVAFKTRQFRRDYCSKLSISNEGLSCFSLKLSVLFSN